MRLLSAQVPGLASLRARALALRQVVDVRENPFSRKPGFSKTALAGALLAEGIEYVHAVEPMWGDSIPWRDR